MSKGWIKTYRSLTDHWVWQNNLRFKAWMDILLRVNHKPQRIRFNNSFINVKAGQTVTSLQKLADSWLCCRDTVSTILKEFEADGMILVDSDNRRTLLTVVNYSVFQDVPDSDSTADSTTDSTTDSATDSTADSAQTRMIKNDYKNDYKNEQEQKKASPLLAPGGYEYE